MTSILIALMSSAFAGERLDEKPFRLGMYLGSAEAVSISKETAVKGYYDNDGKLFINVAFDDSPKTWFFNISTSQSVISVNDEFVKDRKLKVRTQNQNIIPVPSDYGIGGQLKYVIIPELQIGDLVLTDVYAYVSSSKGSFDKSSQLQIGMGALPELAYKISPSAGTISFYPSAQGADVVKSTGAAVPYDSTGWARVRYRRNKFIAPARSLLVNMDYNGQTVLTSLEAGRADSSIAWNVLEKQPTIFVEGNHNFHTGISAGDLKTSTWVSYNGRYQSGAYQNDARIGSSALYQYELAVSPDTQELSFKKVDTYAFTPKLEGTLPYALKQTEPDEEGNEAQASDWSTLSSNYARLNNLDDAIKAIQKSVELEDFNCTHWHTLGSLYLDNNDLAKATSNLQEASIRYHNWWDRSLDERLEIQKSQKGMSSDEQKVRKDEQKTKGLSDDPAWHYVQSDSCYKVDGLLALSYLAQGKHNEIAELYGRLDLDADLAVVQGNSSLAQGNLDKAEAAYRQAMILEDTPLASVRYGLGLYFADQGEWRFAKPLFEEAFSLSFSDSIGASSWFDNARASGEDTIKMALELQKTYPQEYVPSFLLVRESAFMKRTLQLKKQQSQGELETLQASMAELQTQISEKEGRLRRARDKEAAQKEIDTMKDNAANMQKQIDEQTTRIKGYEEGIKKHQGYIDSTSLAAIPENLLDQHALTTQARFLVYKQNINEAKALLERNAQFQKTAEFMFAQAEIASASGDAALAGTLLKKAAQANPMHPVVALFLR